MKEHLEPQTWDVAQTGSRSPSDLDEGSVEALLVETGVAALTASSKVSAQEAALQALASAAVDLPPLRRALLRDQAVQALKRAGFESPARLVDVALPRPGSADPTAGSGPDVLVASPAPWQAPVDGARLLSELEAAIAVHAVLPEGAPTAMALWILHTFCLDAAAITPRLAIVSPTKRCGKTTVLKLLGALALQAARGG